MKKGNILIFLLVIFAFSGLTVAGYFLLPPLLNKDFFKPREPVPVVDETANWKTYQNDGLGFSLNYPENIFTFTDPLITGVSGLFVATSAPRGGNGPKFLGENDLWLEAGVIAGNSTFISVGNYLKSGPNIYGNAQISGNVVKYSLPIAAGNAQIYHEEGLFLRNGKIYSVMLSSWTQTKLQQNGQLFSLIVSTFKFIDQTAASENSGIYGVAVIWPTCPVQRLGQSCTAPFVGAIGFASETGDDSIVSTVTTKSDGSFRANLTPGDYIAIRADTTFSNKSKTKIHVASNQFSQVNIEFDTGIR